MSGPGEYVADASEGITNPDDLPTPKIQHRTRIYKKCRCPHCHYLARQHDLRQRSLRHLGDPLSGRPVTIVLQYSNHYCCKCKTYFNVDMTAIAPPKSD